MDSKDMMMMMKMENENHNPSGPFSSLPLSTDNVDQKFSLGFMELLGFQDFYSSFSPPCSIFDNTTTYNQLLPPPPPASSLSMEIVAAHHLNGNDDYGDLHHNHKEEDLIVDEESSVVLNGQPSSPNCSSISSPAHQQLHNPIKQCMKAKKTILDGDDTKTKKKRKKEREARFAFMTRSEIDNLDDGYRWRKYGQKAVKNSHFPRNYYRCTSASCNVKKRVERCMSDPSYVVTTYEGQHIHPTTSRPLPSAAYSFNPATTAMLKLDQGGLLQDMLHYHQ